MPLLEAPSVAASGGTANGSATATGAGVFAMGGENAGCGYVGASAAAVCPPSGAVLGGISSMVADAATRSGTTLLRGAGCSGRGAS